jgi:hypothetical protein
MDIETQNTRVRHHDTFVQYLFVYLTQACSGDYERDKAHVVVYLINCRNADKLNKNLRSYCNVK